MTLDPLAPNRMLISQRIEFLPQVAFRTGLSCPFFAFLIHPLSRHLNRQDRTPFRRYRLSEMSRTSQGSLRALRPSIVAVISIRLFVVVSEVPPAHSTECPAHRRM